MSVIGNYSALNILRRPEFAGTTDLYSRFKQIAPATGLEIALQGSGPYDVKGDIYSEQFRELSVQRLNRYRHSWRFYKGEQWINPWEDGDRKPVFNYCSTIVDKAVEWYCAKGISMRTCKGNSQIAELLNDVWSYNYVDTLLQKIAQFGAVTGDSYMYVSIAQKDIAGNLLPQNEWTVSLTSLNPAYVFPFWSESAPGEMSACLVQFPLTAGTGDQRLYTIYITPTTFETWINEKSQGRVPNPFGKVNIVYFPNMVLADSIYSQSDIHQIIPVNEEYNITANAIRKVIKYQGEPTTIIYGAKIMNLERSAKSLWSNLPLDARVENLKLDSDLAAVYDYLDRLEGQIFKIASTPKIAVEATDKAVSNTSGLSMQMLYQPLIEKTGRRQKGHVKSYKMVNTLILLAHQNILKDDLTTIADYPDEMFETEVEFTSPLPKDEVADLDLAMKRVASGFWSKAEAIRRTAGVTDFKKLFLELAADERAELAMAYEEALAAQGVRPEFSAVFLSSPFLSEDLEVAAAPDSKDP